MASEPVHTDRRRAESFGRAADRYDAHRPRYPAALIAEFVGPGERVLDVGAGTGIASVQLRDAGADVLAVEPDELMARVAAAKGIAVETATFEDWIVRGRTFDVVVFAQSFHWVTPQPALAKVAGLLAPGGRLALMWNRITSVSPTRDELDEAYAGILAQWQRPSVGVEDSPDLESDLAAAGFASEKRTVTEELHYRTDAWVDMVTTYSNVLTLDPADQHELRARLTRRIGPTGVDAVNDALAVICRRAQPSAS